MSELSGAEKKPARTGSFKRLGLLGALGLLIAALTAVAIGADYRQELNSQAARVQAIADLRSRQVARWLGERLNAAAFLSAGQLTADGYLRWRESGDRAALERVLERMVDVRRSLGFQSVAIVDGAGAIVIGEAGTDATASAELREAALRAMASGRVERTELYGSRGAKPATRMHVVVPLNATGRPAQAAVALGIDADTFLFPELRGWPVPSRSGESYLAWIADGAVNVSVEGRSVPLASDTLSARALRGQAPREPIESLDFRGTPVLGAVSPVEGSRWFVAAKVDLAEVRAAALRDGILIAGVGLLTFLAAGAGMFGLGHRWERQRETAARDERADRLRMLQLVEAMATGSTDAIIGKSLDGTVISWNPGAEQMFGYRAGEILGRSGSVLIPADRADEEDAILASIIQGKRVASLETMRLRKNGEPVAVSLNISPIRDLSGEIVGVSKIVRDMSERRRLEAMLQERTGGLLRAQQMAHLGHVVVAPGGVLESWSETLPVLLRLDPAAMPATVREWLERVHPDDRAVLRDEMLRLEEGRGRADFEYRVRRGDGEWIHLRQEIGRLDAAPGSAGGRWFATLQDVTERARAEAELREAAAFVQAVEDSVLDHMAVLDRAGTVVSVNAAWREFAGAEGSDEPTVRRAVVGADYLAACRRADAAEPGEDGASAQAIAEVIAGTRERYGREYSCRSRGELRWFLMNVTPLRTSGGGAVVVHTDISERKRNEVELEHHRDHLEELVAARSGDLLRANQALHEAEAFLRLVADNIPGRVAYWMRDSTCAFVNKAFCEWYGRPREALIGHKTREIFAAQFVDDRQARVDAVLAGEEQHFEREETSARGDKRWMWIHYVPDWHDGEVRGFFVLASDITEMKKAELRLQLANQELTDARNRAEAATVAKSAFLANMSHEIRTPMNAIIGLTHLLRRDIHSPVQRERLGKVSDAARHLLGVINDILDLSKIESGKLKLESRDFELDAMLDRVCSLVGDQARAKQLELVIDTDHLPRVMRGDVTRLSQALLNLMNNAVKFTERGAVTLRADLVERRDDSMLVRFEVHDTGIGIDADLIQTLFTAFEQADSSTTRRFGGTGLGLSITRQLARIMGGEAGAHSVVGAGSTFWFTARIGHAFKDAEPPRDIGFAGLRVLLADDLAEARDALAEMLRQLGLRVDAAESGEQALAMAHAADAAGEPYAACVLDWKMPGIDGLETWRRVKASGRRERLRGVIVTAQDDERLWHDARKEGIGRVVLKPVSMSTLHDALREALGRLAPAPQSPLGNALSTLIARRVGARVLLAEDNAINREVAIELLRSAGLRVDVAVGGVEAVQLARAQRYDLILMDVQMPELDGLQAARALRAGPDAIATPIIAMTANAFDEDREACLRAGMNDHIAKPVDPDLLYETLIAWLPQDGSVQPSGADGAASAEAAGRPDTTGISWDAVRPALEAIEGFDVDTALKFFDGHGDIYVRVLRLFADTYATGSPALAEAMSSGSAEALVAAGHSIRGASASVGASRLQGAAAALEAAAQPGRDQAATPAAAAALQALLIDVAGRLHRALKAAAAE